MRDTPRTTSALRRAAGRHKRVRHTAAVIGALSVLAAGCIAGPQQAPAPDQQAGPTTAGTPVDTWLEQVANHTGAAELDRTGSATEAAAAASSELDPTVEPPTAEQQALINAARWCPPLDRVRGDMKALECWLVVSAGDYEPGDLLGLVDADVLNFGDNGYWGEIDPAEIGATLQQYIEQVEQAEAERVEAERRTEAATRDTVRRTNRPATTSRAAADPNAGKSDDQLAHECFDLRMASSCGTLADRHLAAGGGGGGGGGGAPEPGPAPAPASPEEPWLYDFSQHDGEHQAWREGIERQAREQLDAQCPGGGRATWYSDGTIFVTCY